MGYREDCSCSNCEQMRADSVRDVPVHILAAEILRQTGKDEKKECGKW